MKKILIALAALTALALSACGGGGGGDSSKKATLDTESAVQLSGAVFSSSEGLEAIGELAMSGTQKATGGGLAVGVAAAAPAPAPISDGCGGTFTYTSGATYSVTASTYHPDCYEDEYLNGTINFSINGDNDSVTYTITFDNFTLVARGVTYPLNGTYVYTVNVDGTSQYSLTGSFGSGSDKVTFRDYLVRFNSDGQVVYISGTFGNVLGDVTLSTPDEFGYSCSFASHPSSGVLGITDAAGPWLFTFGEDTVDMVGPGGQTAHEQTDSLSYCVY